MLPSTIRDRLEGHLAAVRRRHEADLARGFGRAPMPDALDHKYPNAGAQWAWQFVFPAARICRDPQWGPPCRFHLHESVVQRAVTEAVRRAAGPEAGELPHIPALVRDTPARGRIRHPDRAGAARPRRREHDDDLHARGESRRIRGAKPALHTISALRPNIVRNPPISVDLAPSVQSGRRRVTLRRWRHNNRYCLVSIWRRNVVRSRRMQRVLGCGRSAGWQ